MGHKQGGIGENIVVCNQQSPYTRDELQVALDRLLRQAEENGVEVHNHSYTLRHSESTSTDWEVLITEVAAE